MNTKFSFIIPTLNEGEYLENCLRSISAQNQKNYEIIIVDGQSNDKTIDIASRYTQKIFKEPRRGPGAARNIGASNAEGNILIFADADTQFEPDFLEKLESSMNFTDGGILRLRLHDDKRPSRILMYEFANILARILISLKIPVTTGSCFIYKKQQFNQTGGFNELMQSCEDHEFAKRFARKNRFSFISNTSVKTSSRNINHTGILRGLLTMTKTSLLYLMNKKLTRRYTYHAISFR